MPFRFRDWDLDFIAWLNRTGKQVDFLSDDDLERFGLGDELAAAYDLVVFPGHAEYVTEHAYDVVERYRDLGGNLMFLSANNFFWKVRARGAAAHARASCGARSGGRKPALVGVQYAASDYGAHQAGVRVERRRAVGVRRDGASRRGRFGRYGIEIDARSAASPPGTQRAGDDPGHDGRRAARPR